MQRRLLRSFVGIALAMVLALGVPLGLVAGRLVRDQAVERVQREADAVELAFEAVTSGGSMPPAALRPFVEPTSKVVVTDANTGQVVLRSGPDDVGNDTISATAVTSEGISVRVETDGGPTGSRVLRIWFVVAAVGATALALAAGVALVQSRRLARPLRELAELSARLGAGEFSVALPAGRIREVDEVARQLQVSAERLGRLLTREREFSTNASHQLRSGLTALRLRAEELQHLSESAVVRAEATQVLRQVDRLERTVEELLLLAHERGQVEVSTIDLAGLVGERVTVWRPVFERVGRLVVFDATTAPRASGRREAVRQTLDVLLDNALRHGGGAVTITVTTSGGNPVVRVADEGPGILPGFEATIFERGVSGAVPGGTGIGLALARELVTSVGGRLVLGRSRPPLFELYLAPTAEPSDQPAVGGGS